MTRRVGRWCRPLRSVLVLLLAVALPMVGSTVGGSTGAASPGDGVVDGRPLPISAIRLDLPRPVPAPGRPVVTVRLASGFDVTRAPGPDAVLLEVPRRVAPLRPDATRAVRPGYRTVPDVLPVGGRAPPRVDAF